MLDVLTHPFYLLSKPNIPKASCHFVMYHFDILTKERAKVQKNLDIPKKSSTFARFFG